MTTMRGSATCCLLVSDSSARVRLFAERKHRHWAVCSRTQCPSRGRSALRRRSVRRRLRILAKYRLGVTCPLDVPAFTGKVMSVSSETDAVVGGILERAEPGDPAFKNYRHYEIAGSAHISSQNADFRNVGNPQQTPIDISPVYRALFTSLTDWLDDDVDGEHHNGAHHDGVLVGERDGEGDDHGEAPPASVAIDSLNQDPVIDPLAFSIALELVRDADGNAVGGIRRPSVMRDERTTHVRRR